MGRDVKGGLAALAGGSVLFSAYLSVKCDDHFYKNYVLPILHRIDPERVHHLALKAAKYRLLHPYFDFKNFNKNKNEDEPVKSHASLRCKLWNYDFQSPIGLAAGFDKNGEAIDGLLQLGFSFLEVGSVTNLPQPGNEKPRMFRLTEDAALVNRYGCPSDGYMAVFERVLKRKLRIRDRIAREIPSPNDVLNTNFAVVNDPMFTGSMINTSSGLVGVNLTMNRNTATAIDDLCGGVRLFVRAADFIVLNLSTPNTPGVRRLQERSTLNELLTRVAETRAALNDPDNTLRKKPLLLKVAPDLSDAEMQDVAELALDPKFSVDGLVVTNTTIQRPSASSTTGASWSIGPLKSPYANESGGLSGAPLRDRATDCVSRMYKLTNGRIPIIGVGGVSSGRDAFEKIAHGASLVEIYTAIVYEGPGIARRVNTELEQELTSRGYKSVQEAVGCFHRENVKNLNEKQSRSWYGYLWPSSWFASRK